MSICLAHLFLKPAPSAAHISALATSLGGLGMELVGVSESLVDTKVVDPLAQVPSDVDGEATPTSKRDMSPAPPQAPRIRRGHGFAPVCSDVVEVYSVGGEHMYFDDTKDMTTGRLRLEVSIRLGVLPSQVQLLCDEVEISDDMPILSESLTVCLRRTQGQVEFSQLLL